MYSGASVDSSYLDLLATHWTSPMLLSLLSFLKLFCPAEKFVLSGLPEVILIYQYPFHISPLLGNLCRFTQSKKKKISLSTLCPHRFWTYYITFVTVYLCRILHLACKCLSVNLSWGWQITICRQSSAHCLFCKWCLLGAWPCLFHYTSFKAAFALRQQS